MIPDKDIHAMKHDMYDSMRLRKWVDRLLAERELLVAEHKAVTGGCYESMMEETFSECPEYQRAWQAVEDFAVTKDPS